MPCSADIRVVHASRSRHPLAIRPANNGAGSRGLDAKAQLKLPSKNRQARNWQRRQHCKARSQGRMSRMRACGRPLAPPAAATCGAGTRRSTDSRRWPRRKYVHVREVCFTKLNVKVATRSVLMSTTLSAKLIKCLFALTVASSGLQLEVVLYLFRRYKTGSVSTGRGLRSI